MCVCIVCCVCLLSVSIQSFCKLFSCALAAQICTTSSTYHVDCHQITRGTYVDVCTYISSIHVSIVYMYILVCVFLYINVLYIFYRYFHGLVYSWQYLYSHLQ